MVEQHNLEIREELRREVGDWAADINWPYEEPAADIPMAQPQNRKQESALIFRFGPPPLKLALGRPGQKARDPGAPRAMPRSRRHARPRELATNESRPRARREAPR
jgi:hypothetical protein